MLVFGYFKLIYQWNKSTIKVSDNFSITFVTEKCNPLTNWCDILLLTHTKMQNTKTSRQKQDEHCRAVQKRRKAEKINYFYAVTSVC